MFQKIAHASVIVAMLMAMGANWMLLQSIAWSTMLADNWSRGSLTEAMERTFDGKHPCCLCKQIAEGKHSEKKSDSHAGWRIFEFSCLPRAFVFFAPSNHWEIQPKDLLFASLTHAPAVPPPRSVSA